MAIATERQDIVGLLENYNEAFGKADYSDIVNYFDYPASFNLQDKTIGASCKFKLKLIYKKIRGDLPDYYSYSKWDKIDIQLIDSTGSIHCKMWDLVSDFQHRFDVGSAVAVKGSVCEFNDSLQLIITNINLEQILNENNIKLPFFKKIK